jgi:hypothetical protein
MGRHLAGMGHDRDGALHMDDSSRERGVGNDDILVVGEGDDVLPVDDDNGALHVDGSSDVPSGGDDDATTLVIGVIGANSSLDAGDVLAVIDGGAIGAICGSGSVGIGDGDSVTIDDGGGNLDVDALRVGGDNSTNTLPGNCTTVVLAGDNLGGAAIWRKPKRWQRRRCQCERLWYSWWHRPRRW